MLYEIWARSPRQSSCEHSPGELPLRTIELLILAVLTIALLIIALAPTDASLQVVAGLVIVAILFIVIELVLRLLRRPPFSELARAIATYHLNQIKSIRGFSNLQIGASYPIYKPSQNKATAFDVKLVSNTGEEKGYMVVNLDRSEFPIPEFTTEGSSLTEQFRAKLGHRDFRLVWLAPTYSVALDEDGRILAKIGCDPVIERPHEDRDDKISEGEYLELIWEGRLQWRVRRRKSIAEAWHMLPGGAKKSSDLVQTNAPVGNYSVSYAEGYERSPHFEQIDPNTGANTKDYHSGCGPTAWATLIAWHNLLWTPELLRGSQPGNSYSWGNPPEPAWDTYMDRVMMELGRPEYLDNHDCFWVSGNGGITHDGDVKEGFKYIKQKLGHEFTGRATGDDDLQKVHDSIVIDERPVLVKTPNHYCVVAGFWYHLDGNNHYLLLNTGWGGADKWIKSEYLEKYWYLRHLLPRTKTTSPSFSSDFGPVLCTSSWPSGRDDNLWVFWLGTDGKINYVRNEEGQVPDLTTSEALNVTALYPPAVTPETDSGQIYLLYVDEEHAMHLLRWEGPEKKWCTLEFPSELRTYARPAILGQQGQWFTVAFSDNTYGVQVIATCRDLQRPNAWPDHIGSESAEYYWTVADAFPFGTNRSLSLISYQDYTVLMWVRRQEYFEICSVLAFRLAKPDGTVLGYVDRSLSHSMYDMAHPVVSNGTLFVAYRTLSGRIIVERLTPCPPYEATSWGQTIATVAASVGTREIAWLRETCTHEPSLAFMELEQGNHPMLVVGWTGKDAPNRLNLRLLSVDCPSAPLDYAGKPY